MPTADTPTAPIDRDEALARVEQIVTAMRRDIAAVKRARSPEAEAAAFGRAVSHVLPLRVAISDGRAGAVVRALDAGASVRGLAGQLGLSRGMVQQLQHRGRGGTPPDLSEYDGED